MNKDMTFKQIEAELALTAALKDTLEAEIKEKEAVTTELTNLKGVIPKLDQLLANDRKERSDTEKTLRITAEKALAAEKLKREGAETRERAALDSKAKYEKLAATAEAEVKLIQKQMDDMKLEHQKNMKTMQGSVDAVHARLKAMELKIMAPQTVPMHSSAMSDTFDIQVTGRDGGDNISKVKVIRKMLQ